MALPNEFERRLITQLRSNSKSTWKDTENDSSDMFLIRWLRANDYDMKKSEQMLRESKRWRKQNKVDRILDNGLDTFFKVNYPFHLGPLDKRGRPVVVLPLGRWKLKAAVKNGLSHRFRTFVIQCMEAVMKTIENRDTLRKPCAMPITQFTVIVDFEGFQLSQLLDLKVLRSAHHILSTLASNYPETLANCLCINCPILLSKSLQGTLRPLISPKTSSKVNWFGRNTESWRQDLGKFLTECEVQKLCDIYD